MTIDEARRYVLDLVVQLDRELAATEVAVTSRASQILARAVVAAAQLVPRMPTVDATTAAARAYLADPCEATHDRYVGAASASYPFGPGDGCYAVPATGVPGCEVGSGCRSGSGTLASIAEMAGYVELADVLALEFASVGGVE